MSKVAPTDPAFWIAPTLLRLDVNDVRFPVTSYQGQWLKLLAMADEIKQFIEENRERLKAKGE